MPRQILQFEIRESPRAVQAIAEQRERERERERERVNNAREIFDFLKFNQFNLKRAIF